MPIKIGKRIFADFEDAAQYIKSKKKIPIKNARAYVATIERAQKKGAKRK